MNDTLKQQGVIVVNKEPGFTSHDCINIVRRITGIKKTGHIGTLDPEAEGVLPIFIGKATRAIEYVKDDEKIYTFKVTFGKRSDTFDIWGKLQESTSLEKENLEKLTRKDVEEALKTFLGEITQVPPIYSSIKKDGRPLYKYAREGIEVKVPERKVKIYEMDLLSYDEEQKEAEVRVVCSRGTYVRSLCNDLGDLLKTGGLMSCLLRERSGQFTLKESFLLSSIKDKEELYKHLIPLDHVLTSLGFIEGTKDDYHGLKDGKTITIEEENIKRIGEENIYYVLFEGDVIAIGTLMGHSFKPDKVLI